MLKPASSRPHTGVWRRLRLLGGLASTPRRLKMECGPSQRLVTFLVGCLQPGTQRRYMRAQEALQQQVTLDQVRFWSWTEEQQDYYLADYILDLRDGGAARQMALDTIAAVQKTFAGRRRYRAAYAVTDAWEKEVPAGQATPMPEVVVFAGAVMLHAQQAHAEACLMVLCYCALLRIGEGLSLSVADLLLPHMHGQGHAVILLLRKTKRGVPDSDKIILTAPAIVDYLMKYVAFMRARGELLHNTDKLCSSTYSKFNRRLQKCMSALGFQPNTFRSHSLRRGGATHLALSGWGLKDLMLAGRWATERSCRLYIMKGEVAVLKMRQRMNDHAWQRLTTLASVGSRVFTLSLDT